LSHRWRLRRARHGEHIEARGIGEDARKLHGEARASPGEQSEQSVYARADQFQAPIRADSGRHVPAKCHGHGPEAADKVVARWLIIICVCNLPAYLRVTGTSQSGWSPDTS
jgi:hypothetical protein